MPHRIFQCAGLAENGEAYPAATPAVVLRSAGRCRRLRRESWVFKQNVLAVSTIRIKPVPSGHRQAV